MIKIQKRYFEKVTACMVLKLTVYVKCHFLTLAKNLVKFQYLEHFEGNFQLHVLAYVLLTILDVLMTLYVCTYFGMYGKRRPIAN